MKRLLACIALILCLHPTIRADGLSSNGGASSPSVVSGGNDAAAFPIGEKIHLDFDRHEENDLPLGELLPVPSVSIAPGLSTTHVSPSTAATTQEWISSSALKTLTLDPSRSAPGAGSFTAALPTGAARDSGVPDSVVYAGLGVLLLALAWVCAGGRHVHSERLAPEAAQDDAQRVRRVRMMPLRVKR